ncbi:unnamed protein product [Absidia cylindrospora]
MSSLDTWEATVTAEDEAYYQQLYQYEGANKTQDEMAPFLRKAQSVSTQQLNQIFGAAFQANISNVDNKKSFYIALKLIACAQHGINPSSPILSTSTPLPTFEDYEIIASNDRQKYLRIFQKSGPTDGLINGDSAMKILMRSKLPVSLLSQIWNLADIDRQGKLDSTGFVIAMHYVAKSMKENKKSLPHANAPDSILMSARGESPSLATITTPKHSTPRNTDKVGPISPPPPPPPVPANHPPVEAVNEYTDAFSPLHQQQPWTVDSAELASYTDAFNNIDTRHKGYIEGSEAVGFFGHSKLPSSDLAGIWDLADTQNRGKLSLDEFAIAMHLIRRVRGGSSIPTTLPSSLLSHVDAGNQKTLAKQADQLKQSIDKEQKGITVLKQGVQEQNAVVSDLQKQVDALELSLQQVVKQKSDLQTTLDTLKKTEDAKRHNIAQLEKEYNITQTELASLKAAHQQRLALVGISNSQLASAQSLKDKSAEDLALARAGKFDTLAESSPKPSDAPPPPPPSSRHHRTQSLRAQPSPGSSNKRPPAPPPSKKKRAPVPSIPPSGSDNKVTTDAIIKDTSSEKSLAAAVSAGVASVVASSALTDLITSPSPSATALDDTPLKVHREDEAAVDDVEHTQALPDTLTSAPTDETIAEQISTATPEPLNTVNGPVVDETSDDASSTPATTIPDETKADDESTAAPLNTDDTEIIKHSPLDVNTADDSTITKTSPHEPAVTSDAEGMDNAKTVLSEINDAPNITDAKEEPSENNDVTTTAKEEPTEATDIVGTTAAKDEPIEANTANDTTSSKNVPIGTSNADDTTTAAEAPEEVTKDIGNATGATNTLHQTATGDEVTDDTSKTMDVPTGVTDTDGSKDVMNELPTATATNLDDEKEQAKDTIASSVENIDQTAATTTSEVDTASNGGRKDTDSGDAVPNGSPVVVEPVVSESKQPLAEESRAVEDTNTGSPEIHTATTTASGSLKGDDHDFEVVDNASTSSSFMSASMGGDDDALDEFDAAFSETLPDAKMVLSSNTDPSTTSTAPGIGNAPSENITTSGSDKPFYDDDDFDEAFDPMVFTPATTHTGQQQPELSRQMDSTQSKNDPFAVNNSGKNDNAFADAFAPFTATPSQQDVPTISSSAFDDSFTVPQPQTSTGSSTQNEPVATTSTLAPEFMDLKTLVVSPEQVTDYESNPFDEPSFEHPPDTKDQQSFGGDQTIANQPVAQPPQPPTPEEHTHQELQELTPQQPMEPAPIQQPVEQITQPVQQIERGFTDHLQPSNPQIQPPSSRQDESQSNLRAPATVSPSVSTTSNTQSDRQSQQSQQSQQRPPPPAAAVVGTKPVDEGHTTSTSKSKHKGLFSISSIIPKQKGKKSKSKSSKKDKSGGSHEPMTIQQQQPPPPQSPTTMQHYQDPSLENAIPAMSDQEVMANLRDFGIDSDSMKTLTNMGFTVDQAKEALERYDYDVQKATNFLLDQ